MTADDLVEQIFARVADVTATFPTARAPIYRRIGMRQRELFILAAQHNPEYYGAAATGVLAGGRLALEDAVSPLVLPGIGYGYGYGHLYGGEPSGVLPIDPQLIQTITIENPGTSPFGAGREVHIVGARDLASELPPRVTVRNRVIEQVDTDLAGVGSLTVYYSVVPAPIGLADGAAPLALEEPWVGLLEIDGAKHVLRRSPAVTLERRTAELATLEREERELLDAFLAHVRDFVLVTSRHLPPLKTAIASQ